MGTVYKKAVTRTLPANATIGEKRRRATAKELRQNPGQATILESIATWFDRAGRKQSAVVFNADDGSQRVRVVSQTYYAKYRDGDGLVQEVPTGCRDIQAARTKLAEFESIADKIRSGALTSTDVQVGRHGKLPIAVHISDYVAYLRQEQKHPDRIKTTETRLKEVVERCSFGRLSELKADKFTSWLATESEAGRSPAVLNGYIESLVAFGYWLTGKRIKGKKSNLLGEKRIRQNPFAGIGRFDVQSDRRRQRRALTEAELRRLLFVARWRPLAEFGRETIRKTADDIPADPRSRKTWKLDALRFEDMQDAVERARAKLSDNPGFVLELDRRGLERSIVYKLAILTGLRRGEIEALTIGHLELAGRVPMIRLKPSDTKNREAAHVPLRADLVEDLHEWIALKSQVLAEGQRTPSGSTVAIPMEMPKLSMSERLFKVPKQLVKALNRDFAAAGIAKKDERGRSVDVHALRHSFGTMLSTSGVAPRTAQQAMRHSDIKLTMNTYTDPRLLDVNGAVELLPLFPLNAIPERHQAKQTGTESAPSFVAPTVALKPVKLVQRMSILDNSGGIAESGQDTKKPGKTLDFPGFSQVGVTGFEPATSTSRT